MKRYHVVMRYIMEDRTTVEARTKEEAINVAEGLIGHPDEPEVDSQIVHHFNAKATLLEETS